MDTGGVSPLLYRRTEPRGKVRRRVQDLRIPSSPRYHVMASRPALDLSHNESARLAVDSLLSGGVHEYREVLRAEGEVDFLSQLEKNYILEHARDARADDPDAFDSFAEVESSMDSDSTLTGERRAEPVLEEPDVELHLQSDLRATSMKDLVREFMRKAEKALAIVMGSFSDVELLCDLLEASRRRNVSVHLLLDHLHLHLFVNMWHELDLNSRSFPKLSVRSVDGQTYCAKSGRKLTGHITETFIITDWTEVLTGSYSFCWLSWQVHRSLVVLVKGSAAVPFHEEFLRLYSSSKPIPGFVYFIVVPRTLPRALPRHADQNDIKSRSGPTETTCLEVQNRDAQNDQSEAEIPVLINQQNSLDARPLQPEPEPLQPEPEPLQPEPEPLQPEPEPLQSEPEPLQPEPEPLQPEPEPLQPEPEPLQPESEPLQPEPEPLQPEPEPLQPEPEPLQPEPEPLQPEPEPLQPELEPLQPEPEPLQPEPEPLQPEPEPLQPEPEPLQPELEPLQPEPEPLQPEPEPLQPEPEPLQLESEPLQPELEPLQLEPESLQPEPEPLQPELEPLQLEPESRQPEPEPIELHPEPLQLHQEPIELHPEPLVQPVGQSKHTAGAILTQHGAQRNVDPLVETQNPTQSHSNPLRPTHVSRVQSQLLITTAENSRAREPIPRHAASPTPGQRRIVGRQPTFKADLGGHDVGTDGLFFWRRNRNRLTELAGAAAGLDSRRRQWVCSLIFKPKVDFRSDHPKEPRRPDQPQRRHRPASHQANPSPEAPGPSATGAFLKPRLRMNSKLFLSGPEASLQKGRPPPGLNWMIQSHTERPGPVARQSFFSTSYGSRRTDVRPVHSRMKPS